MIEAYKNLFIAQQDMFYFAYKDGKMVKCVFNAKDIPHEFHHLFSASPAMYARFDAMANAAHSLGTLLEPIVNDMPEGDRQLMTNIVTFINLVKSGSLEMMRLAEVGKHRAELQENS